MGQEQKIGLFGGTFNPPHIGHLRAAQACVQRLGLDRLLLVPARLPPHKTLPADSATPRQRLFMAELMAEQIPRCQVSDIELDRQGPSYTCDTVEALAGRYPGANLWLILGTDMFLTFHQWRQPQRIAAHCRLAVVARTPDGRRELEAQAAFLARDIGARVDIIDCPVTVMSSTQVRGSLPQGTGEENLPAPVAQYIRQRGLYGAARPGQMDLPWLRERVRRCMTAKRFRHTLGVEETAARLARRYGEEEYQARVAALLHDVTKRLDLEEQLKLCRHYGIILDYGENAVPLLHADTAAAVAKDVFGVSEAVAQAIAFHTTGAPGMSRLDQIVYLADCIEPNRDYPGVEELRQACEHGLRQAMLYALRQTMAHVRQEGRTPNRRSQQALEDLQTEKVEEI